MYGDVGELELLSKLGCSRPDLHEAVIDTPADVVQPNFLPGYRRNPSLGRLDCLPPLVLEEVFLDIDLNTLVSCRKLNSRVEAFIDGIIPFRRLQECAGSAVAALVRTGGGAYYSIRYLYTLMVNTPACSTCGNFGGFFFIPQGVRCCMYCLLTLPEFQPVAKSTAMRTYWLPLVVFKKGIIPVMKTLGGTYGVHGRHTIQKATSSKTQRSLVSPVVVREAAADFLKPSLLEHLEAKATASARTTIPVERADPRWCKTANHLYRLQSAVSFPYIDMLSPAPVIERGLSCRACVNIARQLQYGTLPGDRERAIKMDLAMYSEEEFLEHVQGCYAAQRAWESIERPVGRSWGQYCCMPSANAY